jgi:alpha-ketoglutarate-dependent taurine dioxygenase
MLSTADFVDKLRLSTEELDGLLLKEQVAFDSAEFIALLPEVGLSLVSTSEGMISIVRGGGDVRDLSRSVLSFDYHTDGLYYNPVPRFVVLLCENPGSGLSTTRLSDGSCALASLEEADREVLEQLEIVYVGKDGRQHSQKLIQPHPLGGRNVLLLGSRAFVRPFYEGDRVAELPTLREVVSAFKNLFDAIDSALVHEEEWLPGNVIVFDNYRYLHCRFTRGLDSERSLLRLWINPSAGIA